MTEPSLRQVREELASIHEELATLPAEALDRRAELKSRQHDLRGLSAKLLDEYDSSSVEDLRAAFDRLQRLRDAVVASHVKPQSTAVGFAGVDTDFNTIVNQAIDDGADRAELENQLEEILQKLRSSK
jgi:hypothetical protein